MKSDGSVTVEIMNDGVGHLTFSHPAGNSMPSTLVYELADKIKKLADDDAVQAIWIKSTGKAFCGGASLQELAMLQNISDATHFFMGFGEVMLAMKECPKPVVVTVQGKVVGGGIGIIAAADWVVASVHADIRLSELSIGIGPFTISPFVLRKIGIGAFQQATFSAEWHDAPWALQHSLYNELAVDEKELGDKSGARLKHFLRFDQSAFSENKKLLWQFNPIERDELLRNAEKVGVLLSVPETKKTITRILEKKPV